MNLSVMWKLAAAWTGCLFMNALMLLYVQKKEGEKAKQENT